MLYIFLVVSTLLFWGFITIVKKNLNMKTKEGLYKHVNRLHRWGEILIIILSLTVLYLIGFVYLRQLKPHYFLMALTALYGFRGFMEWKFEKASNEYITSFLAGIFLLFIFLSVELFFM
ncbi:DUF4181 domain-containing protein [Alkaliphilus peptidifermentans]|uniref:DUF4181 domain-containing protein n=1 Tax=Alkaliphilus peptidifermentans DSM 18978 TaxID=1120976 RepID=A0A1G5IRI0_9FIRM|nr:DUF4181 domain-containing protein [Alkaliphilus peptidifermentans]SCY78371.1 protein of unknown function [Alkaliphilus peptidifermentans DSM 18978]